MFGRANGSDSPKSHETTPNRMREKYFTFFTLAPDWLEGSLAAILLLDSRLAEG
jgi:hypothetical protein